MGEATNQIEAHIEHTRSELGSNLEELHQKVMDAKDWRHHFRNMPMAMMGMAFGGGLLLAKMFGSGNRRTEKYGYY